MNRGFLGGLMKLTFDNADADNSMCIWLWTCDTLHTEVYGWRPCSGVARI